ncbi:MAG TPA: 6-phosphogluconolactonase [Saprospiraceae bacterium]|nr:6-phosphogluconolactonase [Saprospiraceae bacterium]HMQ85090.1 6-phosphogluconolactonase [Saprospiraceae bacterium]
MDNYQTFENPKALSLAFAQLFAVWSRLKKPLHVALSGGSTPRLLFELWGSEYLHTIDWSAFHFWWGDERCVPPDHPESNYKMAWGLFLSKLDIPADQIHRIRGEADPEREAKRYAEELATHLPMSNGWPVFDLILLGMGEDGHTASIFPDQIDLFYSQEYCVVAQHPQSGQLRVSFTGGVLNQAQEVAFLVTGAAKATIVSAIFNQQEGWMAYPAALVKARELTWYLDDAAAGAL